MAHDFVNHIIFNFTSFSHSNRIKSIVVHYWLEKIKQQEKYRRILLFLFRNVFVFTRKKYSSVLCSNILKIFCFPILIKVKVKVFAVLSTCLRFSFIFFIILNVFWFIAFSLSYLCKYCCERLLFIHSIKS